MLPDVDAGIFLDNDMLVLQVPATGQFWFSSTTLLCLCRTLRSSGTDSTSSLRSLPWRSPLLRLTIAERWWVVHKKCWQEQKLQSRFSSTGPSNFQYRKEKQLAVNQKLSWLKNKFPGLPTLDGCKPCSSSVLNGECFLKPLHNCNIFPQKESLPYFGVPGLGLNAGVALMNLTRFYFFPTSLSKALKITYLYLYFFQITGFTWGRFYRNIPVYLAKAQVGHVHLHCILGTYLFDQAIE